MSDFIKSPIDFKKRVKVEKLNLEVKIVSENNYMIELRAEKIDQVIRLFKSDERNMVLLDNDWRLKFTLPTTDELGLPTWGVQIRKGTTDKIMFITEDICIALSKCLSFKELEDSK